MKYLTVIFTLVLVTYGQLIMKYEINKLGSIPTNGYKEIAMYFLKAVTNIGIISGLVAAVIAAFSWMTAMSKFELSSIYPLLSLNFVIVPLLSIFIFGESFNTFKVLGIVLIISGVFIFSKGL